jgi:hypothetical protein
MKINELPADIQHRIFELQIAAGNKPNADLELLAKKHEGNFNWHDSIEDWRFWMFINGGHFSEFTSLYPEGVKDPRVNIPDVATALLKNCPLVLSDHSYEDMWGHIVSVLTDILK